MNQLQIITDFTMGELSPKMKGRFDLEQYYKGTQKLENMIPFFPGGCTLRSGFQYKGSAKTAGVVRLHPLILSPSIAYVLEFGHQYVRFWKDGALVTSAGTPIELVTPWSGIILRELQFAQNEGTLYIVHETTAPRILAWTAGSFELGTMTITGNVGELPFQGAGHYPRAVAFHDGRLYLGGSQNEPQTIWASKPFAYGNFTYFDTITRTSTNLREPIRTISGTIPEGKTTITGVSAADMAKLKKGDRLTGTLLKSKPKLNFVGQIASGLAAITLVPSNIIPELAVGEAVSGDGIQPGTTITAINGQTLTISQTATASKTVATITRAEVVTRVANLAGSTVDLDTEAKSAGAGTFDAGWYDPAVPEYADGTMTRNIITAEHAFKKTIASSENESIVWLAAGRDLIVGTTTGERVIPTGANSLQFLCARNTAIGSAQVQPFMLGDSLIMVDGSGKHAREYLYTQQSDAYYAPPIDALADHILAAGVAEADYQTSPIPIAWFVLKDGSLVGCVLAKTFGMAAWFRIVGPTIESIASVPAEGRDDLYAIVRVGTARYMTVLGECFSAAPHLDLATSATKTLGAVTGLGHLDGPCTALYGGNEYPVTVAAGSTALPAAIPDGQPVIIGKGFTGKIKTMPVSAQAQIGPAHMRPKNVQRMRARLYQCHTFKVGLEDGILEPADIIGPYSGDQVLSLLGAWETEAAVSIVQDRPLDTTILAIAPEIDAGG